jgi:hypothetical protein
VKRELCVVPPRRCPIQALLRDHPTTAISLSASRCIWLCDAVLLFLFQQLNIFDRLAIGDQLVRLHWPGHEEGLGEPMSADDAVEEFQEGLMASRNSGGGRSTADHSAFDDERLKILEEREKWEKEKSEMQNERNQKDYQRAMASVDNAILDLLPKTKEAKQTCDLLNRVTMTFDVVLEKGSEVCCCEPLCITPVRASFGTVVVCGVVE